MNPQIPSGSYEIRGTFELAGRVRIVGTRWLTRPNTYDMVSLDGRIDSTLHEIAGTVPECLEKPFSLVKPSLQEAAE